MTTLSSITILPYDSPIQSTRMSRFSTIVDIGKASFNYDMRRLTEILAFPKAWYRRTLVRRLFLGDLTTANLYNEGDSPSGDPHFEQVPPFLSFLCRCAIAAIAFFAAAV